MGLWAILPGLALLLLASACDNDIAVSMDVVDVRLTARDRSWHASYLLPNTELPTGREVHVPLGAAVHLTLTSPDFISTFTVDDLDIRHFAAPDLPTRLTFFADRVGRYELRSDEMCGRPHTGRERGSLVIDKPADFQDWMRARTREAR